MRFWKMFDLASRVNGSETNTGLGIWFKRVKVIKSKLVQGLVQIKKLKLWFTLSSLNGIWPCKIDDSSSRITGMRIIKIGSNMWLKLGNNIGVDIDSKLEIESLNWGLGSHSCSSSISLKW